MLIAWCKQCAHVFTINMQLSIPKPVWCVLRSTEHCTYHLITCIITLDSAISEANHAPHLHSDNVGDCDPRRRRGDSRSSRFGRGTHVGRSAMMRTPDPQRRFGYSLLHNRIDYATLQVYLDRGGRGVTLILKYFIKIYSLRSLLETMPFRFRHLSLLNTT